MCSLKRYHAEILPNWVQTMDRFDAKLLNIVQRNNRLTTEALGKMVGLSQTACQRRLRKLREESIIAEDISVVAPDAIDRRLTMIVQLSIERERPDLLEAFKRSMLATPEVMQCYYVTGIADFVLIVTARDMQDYDEFTKRFFTENPNIRRFQTSVVVNRVKVGLAIPIDEDSYAETKPGDI